MLGLVFGLAGTALGLAGTIYSSFNNTQLAVLQERVNATNEFGKALHEAEPSLAKLTGVEATVELTRLYVVANSAQQKLAVIDIALASKQMRALPSLLSLVQADFPNAPDLGTVAPNDRTAINSLIKQLSAAQNTVQAALSTAAPSPTASPAANAGKNAIANVSSKPQPAASPYADSPLTDNSNAAVAGNASFLAAFPRFGHKEGWVFLGDTYVKDSALIADTPTANVHRVPSPRRCALCLQNHQPARYSVLLRSCAGTYAWNRAARFADAGQ